MLKYRKTENIHSFFSPFFQWIQSGEWIWYFSYINWISTYIKIYHDQLLLLNTIKDHLFHWKAAQSPMGFGDAIFSLAYKKSNAWKQFHFHERKKAKNHFDCFSASITLWRTSVECKTFRPSAWCDYERIAVRCARTVHPKGAIFFHAIRTFSFILFFLASIRNRLNIFTNQIQRILCAMMVNNIMNEYKINARIPQWAADN